jgi:hypothetical protein
MPTEAPVTNQMVKHIGLNTTARKFIRRFEEVDDDDNFTVGLLGETVRLMTWESREIKSHIDCVREKVQAIYQHNGIPHRFTYLETEYKCGCREEMFRWREAEGNGYAFYDSTKGLVWP